ncbi:hypothetical protein ACP3TB_13665 [Rahnella variigena]|uniref:hypothetical protein n=1 Tax=Rahnella variigena TaxID=574964 RepID=UPI003CED561B
MANSLLESCNRWQIMRAVILERNPGMAMTLDALDDMIRHSVRSALTIAHRVDWDFREAEKLAKQLAESGNSNA